MFTSNAWRVIATGESSSVALSNANILCFSQLLSGIAYKNFEIDICSVCYIVDERVVSCDNMASHRSYPGKLSIFVCAILLKVDTIETK